MTTVAKPVRVVDVPKPERSPVFAPAISVPTESPVLVPAGAPAGGASK